MPSTICREVQRMSDNRFDQCLLVKCQRHFDVPSWFLLLLTTHVATCWLPLPPPESLRGARVLVTGASTDSGGTVGIPSRQAGCPDSNNNEEGVHALHKVCALENVSDAICHLLCTSFYTSITVFLTFSFFVKPSAWTFWLLLSLFRLNSYKLKYLWLWMQLFSQGHVALVFNSGKTGF